MSSTIELVESHPWRLAAAASIPIIGAAVPLYLHINKHNDLDNEDLAKINETRNITAGVQLLGSGALAAGAYFAVKVGLAVLLKISAALLITYLSLASGFILPAAVLLIYVLYKMISCCCSSNSDSHSQTTNPSSPIGDPGSFSSEGTSFWGDRDDDPCYNGANLDWENSNGSYYNMADHAYDSDPEK